MLIITAANAQPSATPARASAEASGEQSNSSSDAGDSQAEALQTLQVYDEQLKLTVPGHWKVVKPRNNLIEMELSIPPTANEEPSSDPATGDQQPTAHGRLTMMSAGGGVKANINRWVGQFRLGRDTDGKDAMRQEKRKLRRAVAHILDIAGTYFDSPRGPFGPKVERPDYRMLAAIIEVEGAGKFFIKLYGPEDVIEENRKAFEAMLDSLEVVEASGEAATKSGEPSSEPTDTTLSSTSEDE